MLSGIEKSRSKSDQVVDRFIKQMINGDLHPGSKLPIESELAKEFGVSRVTLREAFKKLSLMGLIDIQQGHGTYVCEVSPNSFMQPLLPLLILNKKNMDELYDARLIIECGAVKLVAERRSVDDIIKLSEYLHRMEESLNSYSNENKEIYALSDFNFHQSILHATNNFYLINIFETIYSILITGINKTSQMPSARKASIIEHEQILSAIKDMNPQLAESLMYNHLVNAKKFFMET